MASPHSVRLLGAWGSMFALRVQIVLENKDIEFEYLDEDLPNKSQLLLSSNPVHKKVPVLIHNGKPVCESLVILQYIDEVWPSKPLLPKDPYERAQARFWADYVDKKFYDAGLGIVESLEAEIQEQFKKDIKDCFIVLDKAFQNLSGGKPYYGGDCLGLVDVVLASYIPWFVAFEKFGDFKLPDEEECPHLNAWIRTTVENSTVKEVMGSIPPNALMEFAHRKRFGVKRF